MVRRRARNSSKPTTAVVPTNLLEEQYFASPKRKDCKVDGSAESCNLDDGASQLKGSPNSTRTKTERTIGVPLATRSQTRTIENFFKAKTAKENNSKQEQEYSTEDTLQTSSPHADLHIESELCLDLVHTKPQECGEAEFIFEISDDDDTENTEISDEATPMGMGPNVDEIDFIAHPTVSLDGSYSSRSSTNATHNIFLQEPVLTLNVDKTPNQASSIKINKSIEVEPVFSSPPAFSATAALHGRFNQIVSIKSTNEFGSPTKLSNQRFNGCFMLLPENDNSSCDSGVGFAGSIDNNNSNKSNGSLILNSSYVCNGNGIVDDDDDVSSASAVVLGTPNPISTRRRKPATPHRILCPSPTKVAPRAIAHNGRVTSPNTAARNKTESAILSPRKSPRHFPIVATVASKSRRRLNPQQQKDKAPYQNETTKTIVQNGVSNVEESFQTHDYENSQETTAQQTKVSNIKQITKTIIGANNNNNNNNKMAAQPKKNQTLQPLATTTNTGNRELTEFFPVRRSVRKTKTAVKEEMMRTLEQAVLEERAEGLKVAHFEGKGRGIVAERRFQRGEFVVEYIGDLISMNEAMEREKRYALDENAGCYMYYFKHKNQQYCIDATIDTDKLGRLVNHSRNGNLSTKVVVVKQRPHLVLLAKDDILPGEELTYDYGDRSKESLIHHPWLAF